MIELYLNAEKRKTRRIEFAHCEDDTCDFLVEFKHPNSTFHFCKEHGTGVCKYIQKHKAMILYKWLVVLQRTRLPLDDVDIRKETSFKSSSQMRGFFVFYIAQPFWKSQFIFALSGIQTSP